MPEADNILPVRQGEVMTPKLGGKLGTPIVVESSIIRSEGGILGRLEELAQEVESLRAEVERLRSRGPDLIGEPEIDAYTFTELASDGTLLSGVEVVLEGDNTVEVGFLGDPATSTVTKDSYVDIFYPDSNYGSSTTLKACNTANGVRWCSAFIYHAWGSYPTGGLWVENIVLAFLKITYSNWSGDDDTQLLVYPVKDNWDENTITWNNQPSVWSATPIATKKIKKTGWDYNTTFIDITDHLYQARYAKESGIIPWPNGYRIDATSPIFTVDILSRGVSDINSRPVLLFWRKWENMVILGGQNRRVKIYGVPGKTYYLVYRFLGPDNKPGPWSDPVVVTLPASGSAPATPTVSVSWAEATARAANITITGTGVMPVDFDKFEIEVYDESNNYVTTLTIRSNRFVILLPTPAIRYKFRARSLTRSGAASSWSSLVQLPSVPQATISPRYFSLICAATHFSTSPTTTTSTGWVERGSVTYTPPGTGTARLIVIGYVTIFKNVADRIDVAVRYSYGGNQYYPDTQLAQSQTTVAETCPIFSWLDVPAGQPITISLMYRSNNGGSVTFYRHSFGVFDVGRL